MEIQFEEFPKIARLSREIVITEKIDGTNAQVYIGESGEFLVGSRTRWIIPGKLTDNAGFASWAYANKEELLHLGPGRHYGEWWGNGIQRGYDMPNKVFSLFNVQRWTDPIVRPNCCRVVPELYRGLFSIQAIADTLSKLALHGSYAADFAKPEGIVIFHTAAGIAFKKTIEKDESPKSKLPSPA